ncbi:MAG: hypothetical protein IPO98_06465 [Saprospiraceae bacterium]|nr:hypothetical protein [Saprospiraceae bacterium]
MKTLYNLSLFFAICCLFNCKDSHQNLIKISESELTQIILKNNGFINVNGKYEDERGNKITLDSIKKLESKQDLSFSLDFYKNTNNEIILAKLRRSTLKDSIFIDKINEILQDISIVSLDIDCNKVEKELLEIVDRDQNNRKNLNVPEYDAYSINFVINLIDKCDPEFISKLSKRARYGIWLTLQHSPPKILKKYYPIIFHNNNVFKLEKEMLHMMEDRILIDEGKPQKYNSQKLE